MTYLLALQKAIAQTQPDAYFGPMTGDLYEPEYLQGWSDLSYDLGYALELDSETAAKEHLSNWTFSYENDLKWDENTQGYLDRVKKISELLVQDGH